MPPPERRATDTPRSYAALCDYAAMGAGRSLEKLVQNWASSGPTKYLSVVKGWSAKYDWQARVAAYDASVAAEEDAARQALRARRRQELEDLDWQQGGELRRRVAELLAEMPKFLRRTENEVKQDGQIVRVITLALSAGPGELARALKLASDVQRLSVGQPTEHAAQTIEIRYVDDVDPDNHAPDPQTPA